MKIRPIVLVLATSLALPLAGAQARAVLDAGASEAGAAANVALDDTQAASNYGAYENDKNKKGSKGKDDKGSKKGSKPKGSKSKSKPPKGSKDKDKDKDKKK